MSGPGWSWLVWAQGLVGLSPTQALVVGELARLADWRGVAVTSTAHLRRVSGRSRRAVFDALRGLGEAGVVVRERRRWGGHQACTWYRLQEGVPGARLMVSSAGRALAGAGGGEVVGSRARPSGVVSGVIGRQENSRLRATVLEAVEEGWRGPASDLLGSTLREAATSVQFATAVRRRMRVGGLSRGEAAVEVASIAWELLRENAVAVAGAEVPWARLTAIVGTAVLSDGQRLPEGVSTVAADPADLDLVEAGATVGRAVPVGAPGRRQEGVLVGYDDFGPVLLGLVESLLGAGLDETVVWAGTLRVAELATRSPSRRHTLAGEDPRLAELGVSPEAARAWMTLLVGSRRGGGRAGGGPGSGGAGREGAGGGPGPEPRRLM